MRFLDPHLPLKFFKIIVAIQFEIGLQLRLGQSEHLSFLNVAAKIFSHSVIIFAELSGILRVLILAISLSLVWSENFIQAR